MHANMLTMPMCFYLFTCVISLWHLVFYWELLLSQIDEVSNITASMSETGYTVCMKCTCDTQVLIDKCFVVLILLHDFLNFTPICSCLGSTSAEVGVWNNNGGDWRFFLCLNYIIEISGFLFVSLAFKVSNVTQTSKPLKELFVCHQ